MAMQEELNSVWTFILKPNDHTIMGTIWDFRNKNMELWLEIRLAWLLSLGSMTDA